MVKTPGLLAPVQAQQQVELIDGTGTHRQIVTIGTSLSSRPNTAQVVTVTSFKPNYAFPAETPSGMSAPRSASCAALPAGVSVTKIKLADRLPVRLKTGYELQFWANTASGIQRVQVVTLTAAAAAGATELSVESFKPSITYPAATALHRTPPDPETATGAMWGTTYVARASRAEAESRSAYRFWNQSRADYAGDWDEVMGNGTPLLYTDASWSWLGVPNVAWNPYLDKYLVLRTPPISESVWLGSTQRAQGPFTPEVLVTRVHTHDSFAGAYFMKQHPETQLGDGQTIHVTYAAGSDRVISGVRVLRITLP